ncbi:MAG TPA: hypothetical protein VFO12_03045 [Sphingomicrobium sp.]|nr:hypothetical protein [Sphingomicrobium sp.]
MTAGTSRQGTTWTARFAWALLLLIVGAALATWGLSRWDAGARFFGVAPRQPVQILRQPGPAAPPAVQAAEPLAAADAARIAAVESRLAAIEGQAQAAAGSAGRADALLLAFAARRAIDRGVALGYLEPLLVQRFGPQHQAAVATVVTASRDPVQLESLITEYRALGPTLRGRAAEEGWWQSLQRELGSLVIIRRAGAPSPQPQARYDRALANLEAGEVDSALAETMRLPGAANAGPWVARARRYISAHRALDQIESAALLGGAASQASLPAAR